MSNFSYSNFDIIENMADDAFNLKGTLGLEGDLNVTNNVSSKTLNVNSGDHHIPINAQSNTDSHIQLKTKNDDNKNIYLINRDGHFRLHQHGVADVFGVNKDGHHYIRHTGDHVVNIDGDGNNPYISLGKTGTWGGQKIYMQNVDAHTDEPTFRVGVHDKRAMMDMSLNHGVRWQRKDGRWTHFDWVDNNNYIRGNTIHDNALNVGEYVNAPSLRRVGGDWLRVNDGGVGRTAIYGNVSINDSPDNNSGLAVGTWNDKVGQGNILATGRISVGDHVPAGRLNIQNPNGNWSHFGWENGMNYIRNDTQHDGNLNVSGRLNLSHAGSGGDSNSDPYYFEKVNVSGNNNSLRLTINDDADESFQIWGSSCAAGDCGGPGTRQHYFGADGRAIHSGALTATKPSGWSSVINVNAPHEAESLYSLHFGDGSDLHGRQVGMGYIKDQPDYARIWGATRGTLATHIHQDDDVHLYSSGWDPLFSVKGGSGDAYHKGHLRVNNGSTISGRLNITHAGSGGDNDSDPYYFEKVHPGGWNNNSLRLTINDDADESFEIWGNSCGTGDCGNAGTMAHRFVAQGDAYHKGDLKIDGNLIHPGLKKKNYLYYPEDAIIYDNIFDALNNGAFNKSGDPPAWDQTSYASNNWYNRLIIRIGYGDLAFPNGAAINVPAGKNVIWIRTLNDRWESFRLHDSNGNSLGIYVNGYNKLNKYAPDGSGSDVSWQFHDWMAMPVPGPGTYILTPVAHGIDCWISGLAFSTNPWNHAYNHCVAYHWGYNIGLVNDGTTNVTWDTHDWNNAPIIRFDAGQIYYLAVPCVYSGKDKLLYFVEHNNNWNGLMHREIKVENTVVERLRTTWSHPLAIHHNSKIYSRFAATKVPAELTKDKRFIVVRIDHRNLDHNLYIREIGTIDLY